jgi:hypothetical protein
MPLISSVNTATNNWLLISESHGDLNRCTPCRGNPDQHDTYTSYASPGTPGIHFPQAIPIHRNLSQAINSVGRTLLLQRKRAPDTSPNMAE